MPTGEATEMADPATKNQSPDANNSATPNDALPILPKGIVENTAEIYAEVASYDIVPPEKLREYWHVYTTTHRKLYDPTASRLESFWWHVWGSDCRRLSGKTLARLFENISNRPTFVPLRGPPNRFEKPMVCLPPLPDLAIEPRLARHGLASRMQEGKDCKECKPREKSPGKQEAAEKPAKDQAAHLKKISSSSARPPPHQSILKTRPSNGPRPTPRFALPSGEPSEDEADPITPISEEATAEFDSASGSTPESTLGLKSPTEQQPHNAHGKSGTPKHDARKVKPKANKKKFVAGSSALKRKIVVSKRANSHSSAGSTGPEAVGGGGGPRELLKAPRHPGQIIIKEEEVGDGASTSSASSKRDSDASPKKHASAAQLRSAKAVGKQPMTSPKKAKAEKAGASPSGPVPNTKHHQRPTLVHQVSGQSGTSESVESLAGSGTLKMPVASRNKAPESRPAIVPGGSASRHRYTLPARSELSTSQGAGGGFLPKPAVASGSMAVLSASPTSTIIETSAGPSAGMSKALPEIHSAIPLRLCRSVSQDSYGSQYRPDGSLRSALPLGVGRTVTATPSMIAASGIFLETEGPDPFELYAQTGLDDEDVVGGLAGDGNRSGQRPLFTPTRPTQTPRIPFARTRSQLNIILDREKERKERQSEGSFASWRSSRRDDHRPR